MAFCFIEADYGFRLRPNNWSRLHFFWDIFEKKVNCDESFYNTIVKMSGSVSFNAFLWL